MFVQVHACRLYRPDRSVRVEALAGGDTGDYGTGRDDTGDYGTGRDGTGDRYGTRQLHRGHRGGNTHSSASTFL